MVTLYSDTISVPVLSGSVLSQATKTNDKTSAIVRMARTKRILFLLDFITNLAKIYCGALKKAKNITSASPLDFCDKPTCSIWKKAM